MRRIAIAMMAAAIGAAGLWSASCGEPAPSPEAARQRAEARSLAAVMQLASQTASAVLVPWRCTQFSSTGPRVVPWLVERLEERVVRRIAVLAGLREITPASLEQVSLFLAAAAQEPLDAVVLLGGNAATRPALQSLLDAVASSSYLTVVVPGDRERVPEIREVITQHPRRATLVDATTPVVLDAGVARLFMVGGMPAATQLQWPVDGCVYNVADVALLTATAQALPVSPGGTPWVVAMSASPVRGTTDIGATGIKVGDPALAASLAGADAVIFAGAEIASGAGRVAQHRSKQSGEQPHIALGQLDANRRYGSDKRPLGGKALVLTIEEQHMSWHIWSAQDGQWETAWRDQ